MSETNNIIADSSDEFSDASDDLQETLNSKNSEAQKKARIERAKKNANIWAISEESVSAFESSLRFN